MGTYTSKYTGAEIDNLLEQVENGGGATSGYKETVLLQNSNAMVASETVTLNDDITNYDMLFVETCCDGTSSNIAKQTFMMPVSTIVYGTSQETYNVIETVTANDNSTYYKVMFAFSSSTSIYIVTTTCLAWKNPRISKVIGIKY